MSGIALGGLSKCDSRASCRPSGNPNRGPSQGCQTYQCAAGPLLQLILLPLTGGMDQLTNSGRDVQNGTLWSKPSTNIRRSRIDMDAKIALFSLQADQIKGNGALVLDDLHLGKSKMSL